MTWRQLTLKDCREWKLSAIDPHDRDSWRSSVRSAMHAASPCTCMLIQNSMMMIMIPVVLHFVKSGCYLKPKEQ